MPGRDYGQAYARLEEVLRDSSFLRSYDIAQHYNLTSPSFHQSDYYTGASPRSTNHFPPTPPPLAARTPAEASAQTHAVPHSSTRRVHLSTPPNLIGLPTPDVTPPVRRDHLSPLPTISDSRSYTTSPFADSFRTAREDWWSANGSRLSLPLEDDLSHGNVQSVSSAKPTYQVPPAHVRLMPITTQAPESAGFHFDDDDAHSQPLERARRLSLDSHSTTRDSLESSTFIGAFIVDNSPPPRSHKLRKVSKNLDLRSVSSPLPTSQTIEEDDTLHLPSRERRRELRRMRDQSHLRSTSDTVPAELGHLHRSLDPVDRQSPEVERSRRKSYDRSSKSYLGASSISVRSDFSASTLELNEATAVQLFARNNNSVVMVHQPVPPAGQTAEPSSATPEAMQPQKGARTNRVQRSLATTLEPTPESPLTNPRAAPPPPELNVIPPSPARTNSFEATPIDKIFNPRRRPSLLARARANSAPLVDSLGSLRRSATGSLHRSGVTRILSKRKPRDGAVQAHEAEGQSSPRVSSPGSSSSQGKHTFREPHPFWDESLFEDDTTGYPSVADDPRQPTASAARDAGTEDIDDGTSQSTWSKWKRGGSGRGFLIGNTLGIMRGPTNVRRPVFPAMKDMRPKARGRQQLDQPVADGHVRSASAPANNLGFLGHESPKPEPRKSTGRAWWEAVKSGLKG